MVGRAAQGNPWIFREINSYLEKGEILPRPSYEEMRDVVKQHANLQLEFKGEYTGVREMRKHLAWYTTGMPHSAAFRNSINLVETAEDMMKAIDEIFGF
jgi:tRNA-dihydrouridine synthase